MPSNTGKTIKRVVSKVATKNAKAGPRSLDHRAATIEWLRADTAHSAALLAAALETGDAGDFMAALRLITDARGGITQMAAATGLNREGLYRTLSKNGNPPLSSLLPILQASGLKIEVSVI